MTRIIIAHEMSCVTYEPTSSPPGFSHPFCHVHAFLSLCDYTSFFFMLFLTHKHSPKNERGCPFAVFPHSPRSCSPLLRPPCPYPTQLLQSAQTALPAVFTAPIRADIVSMVHTNMAKNHRQPYAVSTKAGHQTAAESWGTGRAVYRIPRVPGGGTHRAGQAAFGNMCRGGHMFANTKTWRRWHRKTNIKNKRYAVCSALAASAVPSLVLARGHRVEKLNEIPLVLSNDIESISKTKDAMAVLKAIGALADVEKVRYVDFKSSDEHRMMMKKEVPGADEWVPSSLRVLTMKSTTPFYSRFN